MDSAERLYEKAREYELLAASHTERAPLGATAEHAAAAATAFTVVAVVLREVACALDEAA